MSDTAGRAPAQGRGHPGWVMVLSPMPWRSGGQTPAAQCTSSTTVFLPLYTVRTCHTSRILCAGCNSSPVACMLQRLLTQSCTQQKRGLVCNPYAIRCRRGQGNVEAGAAPVVAAAEVMAGLSLRPLLSKAANCSTNFTTLNNNWCSMPCTFKDAVIDMHGRCANAGTRSRCRLHPASSRMHGRIMWSRRSC